MLPDEMDIATTMLITRLCDDALTSHDFDTLLSSHPPRHIASRYVFQSHLLEEKEDQIWTQIQIAMQKDVKYHQMTVPYNVHPDKWVVFLVMREKCSIDAFLIGDMDIAEVQPIALKLQRALQFISPGIQWLLSCRLKIPLDFPVNKVFMTFVLLHHLHHHGPYLDLSHDKIVQHKLTLLVEFNRQHDTWFGFLQPKEGKKPWHPFVKAIKPGSVPQLEELGWYILDVIGEGNCGYYCLILGLENNGSTRYSALLRSCSLVPMRKNVSWQEKVIQLRKDLQDESARLISHEYPRGSRNYEWFLRTTAVNDDTFEELSDFFHTDSIRDYFDGSLVSVPEYRPFQMNPYWSCHVYSHMLRIRVIVYTRNASFDSTTKEVSYTWSTTTMDYNATIENVMSQKTGIHRLTDLEFKAMPTVELLYTTGFIQTTKADDNHFMFLRRVICDGTAKPPEPSSITIKDMLLRPPRNQNRNMIPNNTSVVDPPVPVREELSPLEHNPTIVQVNSEVVASPSPVLNTNESVTTANVEVNSEVVASPSPILNTNESVTTANDEGISEVVASPSPILNTNESVTPCNGAEGTQAEVQTTNVAMSP